MMQNKNTFLIFAVFSILTIGVNPMPASGYDPFGPPEPEIENYLQGIETILIDVLWNPSYRYGYPPYEMYAREMEDAQFRWSREALVTLMRPGEGQEETVIEQKLLAALKTRLEPNLLDRVALKDTRLDDISIHMIDLEKTILVTFHFGQQKLRLNEQELLMGSVVAVVDIHHRNEFTGIQKVFQPEPFLLHPQSDDTTSLDRSLDFIALQVSEYLNHLSAKYLKE